ncbi:MAG TPA: hypothetical protein VF533_03465 [Solirubrobacteraceae bacterium]|jgi:TM2 domain-containing membrane protein YozV
MSKELPAAPGRKRIEITEDSLGGSPAAAAAAPVPAATPVLGRPAPLPVSTQPKPPPAPPAPRQFGSFCRACGRQMDDRAAICPGCGVPAAPQQDGLSVHQAVALSMNQKSPGVAVLLSLLVTGAGQIYCGRAGRGIAFFCAAFVSLILCMVIIGFVLLPIVWIWAAVDAHGLAQRQNNALLASVR